MTVVCSMASFGSSVQVRHGATCQKSMVPAPPVTIASFGGGGLASGTRSWMRWLPVTTRLLIPLRQRNFTVGDVTFQHLRGIRKAGLGGFIDMRRERRQAGDQGVKI